MRALRAKILFFTSKYGFYYKIQFFGGKYSFWDHRIQFLIPRGWQVCVWSPGWKMLQNFVHCTTYGTFQYRIAQKRLNACNPNHHVPVRSGMARYSTVRFTSKSAWTQPRPRVSFSTIQLYVQCIIYCYCTVCEYMLWFIYDSHSINN